MIAEVLSELQDSDFVAGKPDPLLAMIHEGDSMKGIRGISPDRVRQQPEHESREFEHLKNPAESMKQPPFFRSVQHAWSGLVFTVRTQRNAKIHLVFGATVLGVACWLPLSKLEIALLLLTIGAVLAGETINTTVEAIVDLLSPEWHPQAKVAKDVAAAGVLILSLTAAMIGLLILGPPLWGRLLGS